MRKLKSTTKVFIISILIILTLLSLVVFSSPTKSQVDYDWIIENDTIYINVSGRGMISQTPHTLAGFTNKPLINFTSYFNETKCLDIAFGFNTTKARPTKAEYYNPYYYNVTRSRTCAPPNWYNYTLNPNHLYCWENYSIWDGNTSEWDNGTRLIWDHYFTGYDLSNYVIFWNDTYYSEWTNITNKFTVINYTIFNKDIWYYIQNITFESNETKTLKPTIQVTPQLGENYGKYDILIKFCEDTIQQAVDNDRYVHIDPWWNTSILYCRNLTIREGFDVDYTDFPVNIHTDGYFIDASGWGNKPYGNSTTNRTLEVINTSCNNGGGNIISQIDNITTSGIYLESFNLHFEANSTNNDTIYSIYYDTEDKGWDINYTDRVTHEDVTGHQRFYLNHSVIEIENQSGLIENASYGSGGNDNIFSNGRWQIEQSFPQFYTNTSNWRADVGGYVGIDRRDYGGDIKYEVDVSKSGWGFINYTIYATFVKVVFNVSYNDEQYISQIHYSWDGINTDDTMVLSNGTPYSSSVSFEFPNPEFYYTYDEDYEERIIVRMTDDDLMQAFNKRDNIGEDDIQISGTNYRGYQNNTLYTWYFAFGHDNTSANTTGWAISYPLYVESIGSEETESADDTTNPIATMGTNPIDYYNSSSQSITFDMKCSDDTAISNTVFHANWKGNSFESDFDGWASGGTGTIQRSDLWSEIDSWSLNGSVSSDCAWINKSINYSLYDSMSLTVNMTDVSYCNAITISNGTSDYDCPTTGELFLNITTAGANNYTIDLSDKTGAGNIYIGWGKIAGEAPCSIDTKGFVDNIKLFVVEINTTPVNDTWWNNSVSNLTDGEWEWYSYCNDSTGNEVYSATNRTFTVDTTPPFINITSPQNISYNYTNIWLNFTTNENTDWIGYSLNGTENVTITGNISIIFAEGFNNITIWANDTVGNTNISEIIYFTIDTTPPVINISSPENASYNYSTLWFNLTLDEAGDSCRVELSGKNHTLTNSTGNWNYYNDTLSDGGYTPTFYCNDTTGNANSTDIVFTIDTTPPFINITSPQNISYNYTDIWLNWTVNENLDWCAYNINGTENITDICLREASFEASCTYSDCDTFELFSTGSQYPQQTSSWSSHGSHSLRGDSFAISYNQSAKKEIDFTYISKIVFDFNVVAEASDGYFLIYIDNDEIFRNNTLGTFLGEEVDVSGYSGMHMLSFNWTSWTGLGSTVDIDNITFFNLEGNRIISLTSNKTLTFTEGFYNITIFANDTLGNMNSTSVIFTYATLPIITISSPTATTYQTNQIWFNATLNEVGGTCNVSISGLNHSLTNSTGNWNYYNNTLDNNAGYVATFYCDDVFQNVNSASVTFSIGIPTSNPETGGGGGVITFCGDGICTYPESNTTCPVDCRELIFSLDVRQFNIPAFPGSEVRCLGNPKGCDICVVNDLQHDIEVIVWIKQVLDESYMWGYLFDSEDNKVTVLSINVPAEERNCITTSAAIPADTEIDDYLFHIVFESDSKRIIFPFNIPVRPQLAFISNIGNFLFSYILVGTEEKGFQLPMWSLIILIIIVIIISLGIWARRHPKRKG